MEVIDKNGKRVVRRNGLLQDGDRMNIPLTMMDSVDRSDPVLKDAIAAADAKKRQEAFDAKQKTRVVNVTINGALSPEEVQALQDKHNATSIEAADRARQSRDARMNASWRDDPADADALVIDQNAVEKRVRQSQKFPLYRPGHRFAGQTETPMTSFGDIAARNAKLNDRWKNPPSVIAQQLPADVESSASSVENADAGKLHPADRRDARLEQMWKNA